MKMAENKNMKKASFQISSIALPTPTTRSKLSKDEVETLLDPLRGGTVSGVRVKAEVISEFRLMLIDKKYKYIILKLNEDNTLVEIEQKVGHSKLDQKTIYDRMLKQSIAKLTSLQLS